MMKITKADLKLSLEQAEREYDLVYLEIIKMLDRLKKYAEMKEVINNYISTKKSIKKQKKSYEHPPHIQA